MDKTMETKYRNDVLSLIDNNKFLCYLLNDVYKTIGGSNNLIKYGNYYFQVIVAYGSCSSRMIYKIFNESVLEHLHKGHKLECIINLCKDRIRLIKIENILYI